MSSQANQKALIMRVKNYILKRFEVHCQDKRHGYLEVNMVYPTNTMYKTENVIYTTKF